MSALSSPLNKFREHDPSVCLLAVPKKGRLYNKCCDLLKGAGVEFIRPNRLDVAKCTSLPLTLVFLPAKDIALYVSDGKVDMGITGEDIIAETGANVNIDMKLGFGKCRLCVQAPVPHGIRGSNELVGKRIVTSFTKLAKQHFAKYPGGEETQVSFVSGSVEAACGLGLADGIVDLVETGTTMMAAGLEIVDVVMTTETVLISNQRKTKHLALMNKLRKRFEGYITAKKYDMLMYNVMRENLEAATQVTPGVKAPTVMNLENSNGKWCAVQVMVQKKETNAIMDALAELGATGIITLEVKNCRV